VDVEVDIAEIDDQELIKEVEHRGYLVVNRQQYPNKSIVDQDLIERFNEGFGKISKQELEEFLTKFEV